MLQLISVRLFTLTASITLIAQNAGSSASHDILHDLPKCRHDAGMAALKGRVGDTGAVRAIEFCTQQTRQADFSIAI
jgi:hypothetical protein